MVGFGLWWLPKWQTARLEVTTDRRFELEDKARATLVQAFGGLFFLVTGYFTWRGLQNTKEASDRQIRLTESGQYTDRFAKAVELLGAVNEDGSPALTKRLGGIYALERIARDSGDDHWTVMEVLTAYVRAYVPEPSNVKGAAATAEYECPADVQAILTVLGRRSRDEDHQERGRLDLSGAHLEGADLQDAHLEEADLWAAHLEEADLRWADLTGANFVTQAQIDSARTNRDTKVDPPLKVRGRANGSGSDAGAGGLGRAEAG